MVDTSISLKAIPLDVRTPLIMRNQVQQQNRQNQRQDRIDQQNAQLAGQQSQLNDLNIQQAQRDLEAVNPGTLKATLESVALDTIAMKTLLNQGDTDSVRAIASDMMPQIQAINMPTGEIERFIQLLDQNPQQAGQFLDAQIQAMAPHLPDVFQPVRDAQGNVVAQQNLRSGQYSSVPDSMGGQGANRPIRDDMNGVARYVDTGEAVFPEQEAQFNVAQQEEQDLAARQEQSRNEALLGQADIALDAIQDISNLLGTTQSGWVGSIGAFMKPSGENARLRRRIQTLRSNIGFDKLMEMKNNSPTGGALGQVSERELTELQATLGSLDPRASDEELEEVLRDVYDVYNRITVGAGGQPLTSFEEFIGQSSDQNDQGTTRGRSGRNQGRRAGQDRGRVSWWDFQ